MSQCVQRRLNKLHPVNMAEVVRVTVSRLLLGTHGIPVVRQKIIIIVNDDHITRGLCFLKGSGEYLRLGHHLTDLHRSRWALVTLALGTLAVTVAREQLPHHVLANNGPILLGDLCAPLGVRLRETVELDKLTLRLKDVIEHDALELAFKYRKPSTFGYSPGLEFGRVSRAHILKTKHVWAANNPFRQDPNHVLGLPMLDTQAA